MALIEAVVQWQPSLLIDDQGQRELTEVVALLLISAALRQAGTAVKGVNEGVVGGRIIDQELLAQREALTNPCEQLPLEGSKAVVFDQVHVNQEGDAQTVHGGR